MSYTKTETGDGRRKAVFHIFDSMQDVMDYIGSSPEYKSRNQSFVKAPKELYTWEDVLQTSNQLWPEGLETLRMFVERLRAEALPEPKSQQRKVQFNNDGGDEVDLDRLRSGQEYWRKSVRQQITGPSEATIVIDVSTSAFVDSADILWRGAAGIALAQILEEKGFSIEIWVVEAGDLYSGEPTKVVEAVQLKRGGDPLDASTLVNCVSGWFFRSAVFTLMETICKKEGKTVHPGLGRPMPPTEKELDCINSDELRVYCTGVFSFSAAVDLLQRDLERIIDRVENRNM